MKIHELMTANVVKLKNEIVDAINNMLIAKGAKEIAIEDFILLECFVIKYNIDNKSITVENTEPFDIMKSEVEELMTLLKMVETNDYQITK